MIDRTIGRYRILSKLGEGGMGTVWKAEDPFLGRAVALKLLPESRSDSPDARQRFLREARAASSLHHPGIATVYDAGESEGRIYIAMHLVDGETLSDRLSRGAIAVEDALRIGIEAAEAVQYAHEQGVLHRDISARNIMIDRTGRVVVVDFGLALPEGTSKLTQTGAMLGTVSYVAPEVLQGGRSDAQSDVYALGVVLYEMLTGRLPFTGERQEAVMYAAVHEDPVPPSRIQPSAAALDAVVLRALAKQPEERYSSAAELVLALKAIASSLAIHEPSSAVVANPSLSRRWSGSRAWTLVLATVLVASTVLSWRFLRDQRASQNGKTDSGVPRVAVLPLQDLSVDREESSLLIEGIGASLATKLGKVLGATVIPWVTSRRFGDASDLVQTAHQMRVDALIVGTLRQAGERVKVTITLVDGQSGTQRWSDEFEENLTDIFALEAVIATSTAAQLKGRLTGQDERMLGRALSRDRDAYLRYLRGSKAMTEDSPEAWETAFEFFEAALELDPDLALAHVGVGAVYTARYHDLQAGLRELGAAEAHFRQALTIDPSLHAATSGLIRVYWRRGAQEEVLRLGAESRRLARAAHESGKEDLEAMFVAGEAFLFGGFPSRAVSLFEEVLAGDPASHAARWHLTIAYTWSGRFDAAIDVGSAYLTEFGPDAELLGWIGSSHQGRGEPEEALLYYEQAIEQGHVYPPWLLCDAAIAARELGDPELERQYLDKAVAMLERLASELPIDVSGLSDLADSRAMLGGRELILHEGARAMRGEREVGNLLVLHAMHGEYGRAAELLCLEFEKPRVGQIFQWGTVDFWARYQDRLLQQPGMQECYAEHQERARRMLEKYGEMTP